MRAHRTYQQTADQGRYGAHWWLDIAGPGSFSANGYEGQFIVVVPQRDLVLVRLGKSRAEVQDRVKQWLREVAEWLSPDRLKRISQTKRF